MSKIQLLDQNTINKIAAGEVVERPASVIKELVENSIDAGATAITIEVKEGGLKLIRITDNGAGISKEEVRTAFLRHSTSKIREANDLLSINSLGFRGEALASIAAVSMVELITKKEKEMTGIRYVIEGGKEKSYSEVGCPTGTTFIIEDLFFNTPARLKFMKTPSTELGYITELVNKLAMGHSDVSFKLISHSKTKLHTSGNSKLDNCIYSIYGKDITKNIVEIKAADGDISINGFIGKPHISRGNRAYENYYINGRYIKSKLIEKAIEDAFKSLLMLHRYPFVVFHLQVAAKDVDVNVHPTKMEVRFLNEEAVYKLVYRSIESGLHKQALIPEVNIDSKKTEKIKEIEPTPEPFEVKRKTIEEKQGIMEKAKEQHAVENTNKYVKENGGKYSKEMIGETVTKGIEKESVPYETKKGHNQPQPVTNEALPYKGEQIGMPASDFIDSTALKSHKVIGQLFNTYWVVELEDKYYLIDQHAAHEKILYEKILKGLKDKIEYGQRLLRPVVVNLSINEMLRYETHKKLFEDLGFEVEAFGEESLIIRSVPFIFDSTIESDQFLQILDSLEGTYHEDKYSILLDDIASMSCKAAVKGNNKLSELEYERLIDDLLMLDNPFNCPHGRPIIISMTKYELEKKFKRII